MTKRNVALDLVLTILFCGLWNIVVQYHQIKDLNYLLKEEKFSIWKLSLYSLLTCFIYYIYFEYQKSMAFMKAAKPNSTDDSDAVIAVVLTLFGLGFVYDAILQSKMNEYVDQTAEDIR